MDVFLFWRAGTLFLMLPGGFTGKQKAEVPRPLTVISADLAKLTIDVFWGGGEMLRRKELKCPSKNY